MMMTNTDTLHHDGTLWGLLSQNAASRLPGFLRAWGRGGPGTPTPAEAAAREGAREEPLQNVRPGGETFQDRFVGGFLVSGGGGTLPWFGVR